MVNLGDFMNQIDVKLQIAFAVFVVVAAPVFGYFFNRVMDKLQGEYEHTSLYVAIGVVVTLVFVALLSWKSALIALVVFVLTGLPMIFGEFRRTERKRKTVRRKRLPYAANGILDEARMASTQAHQHLNRALNTESSDTQYKHIAAAALELTNISNKLSEVRQIQLEK